MTKAERQAIKAKIGRLHVSAKLAAGPAMRDGYLQQVAELEAKLTPGDKTDADVSGDADDSSKDFGDGITVKTSKRKGKALGSGGAEDDGA